MITIIGAGLSGLIAAIQFPQAQVFEANGPDTVSHRAVLRFRSDKLSRISGIPFRRVTVRKSIYSAGKHVAPNIGLANMYSRKVSGSYLDRSIWNMETVERYIAPEDIQQQLAALAGNRIHWNTPVDPNDLGSDPVISTVPMPLMMRMLKSKDQTIAGGLHPDSFAFASIKVDRFRIHGADIYQTVYYPDHSTSIYRASMTGSLLIVERMDNGEFAFTDADNWDMICRSFGLLPGDLVGMELGHQQRFGKISPIDDTARRQFIYNSTVRHHVYALGRFATWRNILLDDVIDDAAVIKRLIQQGHYSAALQHHKAIRENQ